MLIDLTTKKNALNTSHAAIAKSPSYFERDQPEHCECDTFQYMIEGIVSLETYCHELAHMLHNISTRNIHVSISADYISLSATLSLL
jgi:hypothetical protein